LIEIFKLRFFQAEYREISPDLYWGYEERKRATTGISSRTLKRRCSIGFTWRARKDLLRPLMNYSYSFSTHRNFGNMHSGSQALFRQL